jgi:hypothetical protein
MAVTKPTTPRTIPTIAPVDNPPPPVEGDVLVCGPVGAELVLLAIIETIVVVVAVTMDVAIEIVVKVVVISEDPFDGVVDEAGTVG